MASETVDPIDWLHPPTLHRAVPPELHILHTAMRAANRKTYCTESATNVRLQNARPTHCRCGHCGYKLLAQKFIAYTNIQICRIQFALNFKIFFFKCLQQSPISESITIKVAQKLLIVVVRCGTIPLTVYGKNITLHLLCFITK